ncbi:hypothetical protein F5876DRAFT_72472 [Lentinula aff. lateritia]|uniref:Uncharacterized protein n=1 Tax=Lentinula aff. lateritia TaxID=2804960 RepID=A0ACC1UE66_9AGAR|nr:hypothetical protein F5876DRAFT_72472 [Lentinula aff. lateritia]
MRIQSILSLFFVFAVAANALPAVELRSDTVPMAREEEPEVIELERYSPEPQRANSPDWRREPQRGNAPDWKREPQRGNAPDWKREPQRGNAPDWKREAEGNPV